MAFRRTYPIESEYASELYVEVFVECSNCGNQDEIFGGEDVEYVNNQFHNEETIDSHGFCQMCGEKAWEEKGELALIGYQTSLDTTSVPTVDSLINTYASLIAHLETARVLGFTVHSSDSGEKTMALWRDADQIE